MEIRAKQLSRISAQIGRPWACLLVQHLAADQAIVAWLRLTRTVPANAISRDPLVHG
jgi:hypothetical protein